MKTWRGTLAVAAAIPLGFLAIFFLWPVAALLLTGLFDDGSLDIRGSLSIFTESRTLRVIAQTLAQATAGTAVSITLGFPAAWLLYRTRFRGQAVLRALLTVPFVLPTVVVGVAFAALFGEGGLLEFMRLDRSFTAIVLALAFFNVTVVMRVVGGFWATLDDRPEQAARMLGATPTYTFLSVTVPRLIPAIGSASALVFLFCSTAFGVVLVLGGTRFSNIETETYRLTMQFLDLRGAAMLAIVQAVIVVAALSVSAKLRQPVGTGASRRASVALLPKLSRVHTPVVLFFGLSVLILHVLPITALIMRSLKRNDGSFTFDHYLFLVRPPEESPLSGTVVSALGMSLKFALISTALALLLGVFISLILSRRPRRLVAKRGLSLFEMIAMLPLGVSAVTLGLGLLLTMHKPLGIGIDLRTSVVLIPIAQALVALPLVVRTMLPVLQSIDPRQLDGAAMLGASSARVFRTIELPMLGKTFGLAIGFAFATSLGEFGATSFLVRGGEQTLPVVVAELISHQAASSYGTGLAAAIVLGLFTTAVMLVAEGWRVTEHAGEW